MLNKNFWNINKFFAIISFAVMLAVVNVSLAKTPQKHLRILVIDKATSKPLKNKSVEIYSDNGIRCIQAPCPTNGIEWKGKTDKNGYLVIPNNIRQASMTIELAGYEAKELNQSARKVSKNRWIISLSRE